MTEIAVELHTLTNDNESHLITINGVQERATTLKKQSTELADLNKDGKASPETGDGFTRIKAECDFSINVAVALEKIAADLQGNSNAEAFNTMSTDLGDAVIEEIKGLDGKGLISELSKWPKSEGIEFSADKFDKLTLIEKMDLLRVVKSARNLGENGDGKPMTLDQYKTGFKMTADLYRDILDHNQGEFQRYLPKRVIYKIQNNDQ